MVLGIVGSGIYRALAWVCLAVSAVSFGSAQVPARKRPFEVLDQFSESVQALSARVAPSVVQVVATRYGAREESAGGRTGAVAGRQQSVGSGVIVDPNGYIVTNAHVVAGEQRIRVSLVQQSAPDGANPAASITNTLAQPFAPPHEATLVGVFKEADLALLKIAATGLPALPFAEYTKLRQGQVVFAFGSRGGLNNSVSMGVVSSIARQPDPDSPFIYIQTDAPINPGDSGGPLVNTAGEVVGLDTFILSQSGGSEGIGFAIPSPLVKIVADQLRKYGHFHRVIIGIGVQTITPVLAAATGLRRDSGVVISDILPGSPAELAGLKRNDIVLAVDSVPMENLPHLMLAFLVRGGKERLHLEVLRDDQTLSVDVATVEEDHASDRLQDLVNLAKNQISKLGIVAIAIDKQTEAMFPNLRMRYGVVVTARSPALGATVTDLQVGDVIHEVNGAMVATIEGLREALEPKKRGDPIALFIEREGKLLYVAFEIE